ncbi:DUF805 domain-containing protein [Falsigemmobacter intermedius]|uniref:DUF805 domain-containing protein n=1 Tax=Falsigemmobacter intermedius TaxID=1553448 RepID=A0A3S3VRP0_9RHOB|nr:DUF805 domain-containing protein [Falsigemmobacter intermedius]RWY41049.1 DUF805 domain-containing protein [Falsigemmobacter intermedius]
MKIVKATARALNGIAEYQGRAGRGEYWWFLLFCVLVAAALIGLDVAFQGGDYRFGMADVWALLTVAPLASTGARRLHDTGRSGWWQLVVLVPVFGALLLVAWLAKPSDPKKNAFGKPVPPLAKL